MNRPYHVGVPTLETAHREWPQRAKIDHFVAGGIGVWKNAREALVARPEFVELITRHGNEAAPRAEYSLTGAGTRQDDDMERAISAQCRHFIHHRADIENVDVIGAANHVVVAGFQHHPRG